MGFKDVISCILGKLCTSREKANTQVRVNSNKIVNKGINNSVVTNNINDLEPIPKEAIDRLFEEDNQGS